MSEVFALGSKIMCNHDIAGLDKLQRQLCRENPNVMVSIGKGAKLGVEECQKQFKDQRWNCTTMERDVSVFGKVMKKGINKFIQKLTSLFKLQLLISTYTCTTLKSSSYSHVFPTSADCLNLLPDYSAKMTFVL